MIVAALIALTPPWTWPLEVALGAAAIGYAIAYLQLFIHEAAHFNLHPNRRTSDRLAVAES